MISALNLTARNLSSLMAGGQFEENILRPWYEAVIAAIPKHRKKKFLVAKPYYGNRRI